MAALAENAATDVLPDGVHCECSSDYHMIVLRSFVGTIANARLAGIPVPPVLEERTRAMCDVALHLQRPDGLTPSLSDGDPGDYRSLLRRAGELFDRPDLLWAASGGAEGRRPRPGPRASRSAATSSSAAAGATTAVRYSDERWSVLDCGPLGEGGHGHYDQLSVELMADGHPVVVDPGRFTYAEDGTRLARVVQGDRRPQHRDRRRPRPDAVPPGQAEGPDLDRAAAVAAHRTGPGRPVRPRW